MSGDDGPGGNAPGDRAIAWPRHVRVLAVTYVLSRFVGPLGFFVLGAAATALWVLRDLQVDAGVAALWLGAWASPLACAAFRWWFPRWGRRRWPDPDPTPYRRNAPGDRYVEER